MFVCTLARIAPAEVALPASIAATAFYYNEDDVEEEVSGTHPEESLASTVADLQQRVMMLEDENDWLRREVCCAKQGRTLEASGSSNRVIQFQGRIHADVWTFPKTSPGANAFESGNVSISPQDTIELRRARFAAFGELRPDVIYKLDFELSEAADPQFRDLYIGWKNLPILHRLLVGNQKRPYGLDHLNSSNFNVFMERPLAVQAFNHNNRRFGLVSYGVSDNESWNWRYGVVNLREIQSDGVYRSDNWQLEMTGRLAHTIFRRGNDSDYVHLALATGLAFPDGHPTPGRATNEARFRTEPEARTRSDWLDTQVIDGASEFHVLGTEAVANIGRLQLTGEYLTTWVNRDTNFGDDLRFHGGSIYLSYFLTDHFQPWNRQQGIIGRVRSFTRRDDFARDLCGAWQIGVRWSFADLSDSNIAGGVGESITAAINWYGTPRIRWQLNCSYGNIYDHRPVAEQTFGNYVTIGTRLMADF